MRRSACVVAALVLFASPVFAAGGECSCKHLESLQQEVANSRYEAQFFAGMARKFSEIRKHFEEANKDPANPDAGVDWANRLGVMRQQMMANEFHLPHPQVAGYTGPASVDMPFGTCEQKAEDLAKLGEGSPCKEIGDIALAHEAAHRALCTKMGAGPYWARTWDLIAAEEAERYAEQANAMENLLKSVIDKGSLTVEAVLTPTYTAQGFSASYSHTISKMTLKGHSSDAPDWALNGQGKQVSKIERLKIVGMSCTPSGELVEEVDMTAMTDGFSLSLGGSMKYVSGQIRIKCKKGMGMSAFEPGEVGAGSYFENAPFKPEMSFVRDASTMDFAQILKSGGIGVTGEERVTVKLECPGE